MSGTSRRIMLSICGFIAFVALALGIVFYLGKNDQPVVSTQPASKPIAIVVDTTIPASAPARTIIHSYGDLLHADLPRYPATQRWAIPVDLADAAHVILREPIYVCPRGDLWLTRPDGEPLPKVLARAADENEHVSDRIVLFVIWSQNQLGKWEASAICPTKDGCELITATGKRSIPWRRDYHWEAAMAWDDNDLMRVVVPSSGGVSIISISQQITEDFHELPVPDGAASKLAPAPLPAIVFDLRGVLAWRPVDMNFHAPTQVARFLDGKWADLDPRQWLGPIVHLVPMLDGSVLQLRQGDDSRTIEPVIAPLDASTVDEAEIVKLVAKLGDDDPDVRVAAFGKLTEYGPGIFPILEKLQDNVPTPEAQARIRELLQNKLVTKLGGMIVNENQLTVVKRLRDGGAIFYAPQGVSIPRDQAEPDVIQPDYLVIRPGRPIQQLPEGLLPMIKPADAIDSDHDEWVVTSAKLGPRRYLPPHELDQLLRDSEQGYAFYEIDGRGRWLFHREDAAGARGALEAPGAPANPARGSGGNPATQRATTGNAIVEDATVVNATTQPAAQVSASGGDMLARGAVATKVQTYTGPTLILDPTIPDPSPRLAIWMIDSGMNCGWNKDGWPVFATGSDHWMVNDRQWEHMAETDAMLTDAPAISPPKAGSATTKPGANGIAATAPAAESPGSAAQGSTGASPSAVASQSPSTSQPASSSSSATIELQPAVDSTGPLLAVDLAGNCYYEGKSSLTIIAPSGFRQTWSLPADCIGTEDHPWLVCTREGMLFLFNDAGKVIRLRPTPGELEPLAVDAVFSHRIPHFGSIKRIWLDPAGRIAVAYDESRLAILFPTGQIPPEIADKMLAHDVVVAEPDVRAEDVVGVGSHGNPN